MPTTTVSSGESEEIYRGDEGDALFIQSDSKIRVASREAFVRDGRTIESDMPGTVTLKRDGEKVYVYADGADATVNYEIQGFELNLFGKEIFEITNVIDSNTQRISASAVKETNADQSSTLDPNTTQTTTVRADSGEVWELKKLRLDSNNDLNSSDILVPVDIEVQTESQGVQLAQADYDIGNTAGYLYESGAWRAGTSTRDNTDGTLIDDSNGFAIDIINRLAALTIVDDFEDGVDSGWSGDTGSLSAQTGTVLEGSQTGEFTAANQSIQVTNTPFSTSSGLVPITTQIDNQTGNANDEVQFHLVDSTGTVQETVEFEGSGNFYINGVNEGTWTVGTQYTFAFEIRGGNAYLYYNQSTGGYKDFGSVSYSIGGVKVDNDTSNSTQTVNAYFDAAAPTDAFSADYNRRNRFQFDVTNT